MTNQTEFTPEIMANAKRRLRVASFSATLCLSPCYEVAVKAVAQLLTETGFKPDVDPIEAKAREIVADKAKSNGAVNLVKLGILAGMEMGK